MTNLVQKYDEIFPIFASDYNKDKKAYDNYLNLFDKIMNSEKSDLE